MTLRASFVFIVFVCAACVSRAAATASKPNIVFILADDLGWADVAFHHGNAPTPHLDKLVREGVELTQHYSAATCSPTRTGFMTGRCWSRFGIDSPDNRRALPWDTITLPRALKSVGYETALMGKWHLGSKVEWGPNHFGFDHSYGSLAGGVGPWNHFYKEGEFSPTWHRNEKLITEEGHVTDLIAKEAITWLEARKGAPFFLYVPFTAVHLPLKEPKVWLDKVPTTIRDEVARNYAASVMHLDDAIGKIVAAIEKAGQRDNTLIVFTSDNGGSWAANNDPQYPADNYPDGKLPGNNVPWRGQKGELYEGGIHVPAVVNWPGKLRPGKIGTPVQIIDWMPTFCALTGYTPPHDLKWDGVNQWPIVSGQTSTAPARVLYWTTPRAAAVREGDYKLIVEKTRTAKAGKADKSGKGEKAGKAEKGGKGDKVELFDLAKDPYEKNDLAPTMPDKVAALKRSLAQIAKADDDSRVKD